MKDFAWKWLGIDALNNLLFGGLHQVADAQKGIADINLRMEHLAKRMDEAEILLKRIRGHVGYHG